MDEWCILMTDFSSVEHLERAFKDARAECYKLHKGFLEAYTQLKALQSENETLLKRKDLRAALANINNTHNSLMTYLLAKIDERLDLRTRLVRADNSSSRAPYYLLFTFIQLQPHALFSTAFYVAHSQLPITQLPCTPKHFSDFCIPEKLRHLMMTRKCKTERV